MDKIFYTAIFHKAEGGGFWISFPDFSECFSQGEDMTQAYEMAVDALGLCISDIENKKGKLPMPTAPADVLMDSESILVIVEFDKAEYDCYKKIKN